MIGNEIFEKFDVVIDFPNRHLYLKPNSNFDKPFQQNSLGFTYSDNSQTLGGWIVNGFHKDSNAEKSGLQLDDKIISVNNISVKEIRFEQQKAFFNSNKKITLLVERNGSRNEITFKQKEMLKTSE